MAKGLLFFLFWVSSCFFSLNVFANSPFFVEKSGTNSKKPRSGMLFEHDGYQVWRSALAKSEDFKGLYWINIDGLNRSEKELSLFGEILYFKKRSFVILRSEDTNKIFELSGLLHEDGLACGAVFSLQGDTQEVLKASAEPVPLEDLSIKNPLVEESQALVSGDQIAISVEEISNIHTRYYRSSEGKGVANKLIEMYSRFKTKRDDVVFETFSHGSSQPQASLVVRILGQERPEEILILGSHIDSINSWGGTTGRAPGADDNASGTATNLEIFRVLMKKNIRLKRTLEIHGYAAEEIGLLGSQDIATTYRNQSKNVVAMLQHDMNLYSASGDKIWFVTNNTSSSLNGMLERLLNLYQTVAYGKANLSGGNSDHYSWTRKGYHAAFPFENPSSYNNKIHTSEDTIANSGRFNQATEFAKLGLSYVLHFAGLVH